MGAFLFNRGIRIAALCLAGVLALAGCVRVASVPPTYPDQAWALSGAIMALSADVDPSEARRAAEIAVSYPLELRQIYGVTDSPLIHNTKVNLGQRPRGLCWHWADDLEQRLAEEGFETLKLHRAIANATSLLIDHSTVVLSAEGATMEQGIVLDGWRQGGVLFWSPVNDDPRYKWERRADVFARRR
jgi:hypothetical protein